MLADPHLCRTFIQCIIAKLCVFYVKNGVQTPSNYDGVWCKITKSEKKVKKVDKQFSRYAIDIIYNFEILIIGKTRSIYYQRWGSMVYSLSTNAYGYCRDFTPGDLWWTNL